MAKNFCKKNILTLITLTFVSVVIIILIFFGQMQKAIAVSNCNCNNDNDCPGHCPTPVTPSGLSWLSGATETMLRPTWASSPASSYYNLVGVSGSSLNVNPTNVYYDHSGLNPGTYYSYKTKGCNTDCQACGDPYIPCSEGAFTDFCGPTGYGPDVCGSYSSTWGTTTAFTAPTGIGVSCWTSGNNAKATVNWTDNSSAETGYKIEYKYAGGSYSVYATVAANTVTYDTNALNQGQTVYFKVRAYHSSGTYSSYTGEDSCVTTLVAPSSLTATEASASQINLSWSDNSLGEQGFKIERKIGSSGTWSVIQTTNPNIESYSNTGLANGTHYYYRVRAYYGTNYSSYSNTADLTLTLPAPSGLNCSTQSTTQINLSWTDNSNAEDGFKIERASPSCSGFSQIGTDAASPYSSTGLSAGTSYCYRVSAYTEFADSSYSNTDTCVTAVAPPTYPPGISASALSTSSIYIDWIDVSGETGYKVEQGDANCSNFSQINTTGADVSEYTATGLSTGTTYCYRVRAYNSGGDSSYSNNASATTLINAPSSLTATAASISQINLSWTDNSTGETGFKIYRATGSCSGLAFLTNVAANSVSYSDTSLAEGTTYCYYVTSYTGYLESSASNNDSATTTLSAPSGLGCVTQSANQINLSWTDNSVGETGFKVERATTTCSSFIQIATPAGNSVSYSSTGLTQNTTYCYRLRAYTSYTDSSYSGTASCTTTNPPAAPTGLTATASATSSSQINLAWTDNSTGETGFRLRRAAGSSCDITSPIALTVGSNVISASDIGLNQGTKYCYVACAYNNDGEACSSLSTAITSLPAPSAISFGTIAPTSLTITWTDNSTGETGFKVERAIGSCSTGFSQIDTASANAVSYTDTTLSCSAASYDTYCYRVRAYTADADSSYATIASTKPTLPCAASSLNASIISASQIDLSWNDNSGNETGFKIDRKTGSGGMYSLLTTKSAGVTSHNDSSLTDGTTYYYRVYPYNDDGNSSYSNEVFATTTLPVPSSFLATANSSSQINLTWTDNSTSEVGFKIERATTTCSGFLPIHTTVSNVTSYSDEGLVQNTLYCYRVYAFNNNTSSSYSSESSATTEIFFPSGYLESSTFDVNGSSTFNTILWNGQLNGGHVRFTFASSNCPNGSTDYPACAGGSLWGNSAGGGAPFLGSDGTETGYYGPADPNKAMALRALDHSQRRYFRYRVYLTAGPSDTPTISSVIIGYSP